MNREYSLLIVFQNLYLQSYQNALARIKLLYCWRHKPMLRISLVAPHPAAIAFISLAFAYKDSPTIGKHAGCAFSHETSSTTCRRAISFSSLEQLYPGWIIIWLIFKFWELESREPSLLMMTSKSFFDSMDEPLLGEIYTHYCPSPNEESESTLSEWVPRRRRPEETKNSIVQSTYRLTCRSSGRSSQSTSH